MSLLLPLIKNNKLLIPGYTEPISAAKTFQLFVTRRLDCFSNGVRMRSNYLFFFIDWVLMAFVQ